MTNAFYNATGNPATGSEALSSLVRAEFALVAGGFSLLPQLTTTGAYTTVFAQHGNNTFQLPATSGTFALLNDVTIEATARAAADTTLTTNLATATTNIASNTAAIALLAPKASPTFTGTVTGAAGAFSGNVTFPTQLVSDNSTKAATTAWVAAYLSASGYAPTGASPVTSVAGRTGAVTLTHSDLTDWTATLAPYALLASPTFTGTPLAPTAAAATNTTQVATTAFVTTAVANEATARNTAISAHDASPTFTGTVTAAAANFSGNVTALNYGVIRGSTATLTGALTGTSATLSTTLAVSGAMTGAGGASVVLSNGGSYNITITGTSAGCSGNSVTATTATNLSGGSVSATVITSTGGASISGASTFMNSPNTAGAAASVHIVTNTNQFMAVFQYVAGNTVGSISTNGSSVTYNMTSDYRTKITYGRWLDGDAFDRVAVHDASYKTALDVRQPVFMAHELQEAGFGFAVRGEKDAEEMQQVDQMSLIPALWAMVQDLRARVATLEGAV